MMYSVPRLGRTLLAGAALLAGACLAEHEPVSESPMDGDAIDALPGEAQAQPTPALAVAPGGAVDASTGVMDEPRGCVPHRERALQVTWAGEVETAGESALTGTRLTWRIANTSPGPLEVEPTLTLNGGTMRVQHVPLRSVDLESGYEVLVSLDLAEHIDNLAELPFSGMAMLTARDRDGQWTTVGEPRFFHADGGLLHVYDEVTMARRYHHGDFRHLVVEEPGEGLGTTRILSAADAIRTDDDELELEVQP